MNAAAQHSSFIPKGRRPFGNHSIHQTASRRSDAASSQRRDNDGGKDNIKSVTHGNHHPHPAQKLCWLLKRNPGSTAEGSLLERKESSRWRQTIELDRDETRVIRSATPLSKSTVGPYSTQDLRPSYATQPQEQNKQTFSPSLVPLYLNLQLSDKTISKCLYVNVVQISSTCQN